jgi:2-octaprenyl-6-methoxyphenol hydroxylase
VTTDSHSNASQFDIVIAGGGMTGAMLALVLLQQQPGLKLAIIEQQAEQQAEQHAKQQTASQAEQTTIAKAAQAPAVSFDSRSIALSAASVELLQQWGLWQDLRQHGCAIQSIQVSDRGHFGKAVLNASEFGRRSLGQVIEIEWLGALLYPKLQRYANSGALSWFRPARISAVQQHTDHNWLQLDDGRQLSSQLLVLAEGGDSPTRQLAGFQTQVQPYQQTALIANIGIAAGHQHIAYERFTANGPLALLPLTRQRYSLVWTLAPAEAEQLQQLPQAEFLTELQRAFGYSAGIFTAAGQRQLYPLALKYSTEAARHRILLCGNSLHNLHPIAGQGFNLALRDIAAIIGLVAKLPLSSAAAAGDRTIDYGCYPLWRSYQQLRQADMQQVIQLTDGMVKVFSNQSRLLALGRNLALTALMQCQGLKQLFAGQTMGLTPLARQQQQVNQFSQTGWQGNPEWQEHKHANL